MWNFNNKKGFRICLIVGTSIGVSQFFTNWNNIRMNSVDFTQPGSISTKDKLTQETIMSDGNNMETTGVILEPKTESRQQQSNAFVDTQESLPVDDTPAELEPQEEFNAQVAVEELPKSNNSNLEITDNSGEKNVGSEEVIPLDPEFSLHRKIGSWGWHHLTGEEAEQDILANQSVCKKPFEHCCLGQGRQQVAKVDDYDALWKLKNTDDESLQLGTFGDVLNHYPAGLSKESMCTFAFFGDSLSADTAMGAVCETLRLGYKLKSCDPLRMGAEGVYGEDLHYACEENRYNNNGTTASVHFLLENENSRSCPSVLIEQQIDLGMTNMPSAILELGGILIFNWGVHCNADDGCLDNVLSPLLHSAADEKHGHWRFMFRESEPQHFATPGGLYHKDHAVPEDHTCANFRGRIDNWRNIKVVKMIEDWDLKERIPVLPISSALEPLISLHYDGPSIPTGDCTHYVYDPHRLDVTWDALLTVLQGK